MQVTAAELAERMEVSRPRVTQWVQSGVLDGCFTGEGRGRRFDLGRAMAALGRNLDPAQMLGNGARTRRVLRAGESTPADLPKPERGLPAKEPDRYELARILNAEEDLRRKRRDNEREEGRWILAEAAERSASALVAREIGQFEAALRDGARKIADTENLDYRSVRAVLLGVWRDHRAARARALARAAELAELSDAEREEDG
ncbi:hypothetical protein KM176_24245 [Pseudooceanicola sp. CBS1P-1]|uniref:Helix-turn-helix domain-containing protein n=1 Tax=Pseudooceanicola albus TaxID=2692189 RepID=A0A6L7GAS4_9RHOB|nr:MULTISPECIES: hypothetical protein [Pseudooceanicola]MBT9386973.1 hypothetical protein [Pseudooceanicola endophyticus]MXN21161.1 hypothetical protein [Pseudooceanicola albus]